jgi:hypothetical protein
VPGQDALAPVMAFMVGAQSRCTKPNNLLNVMVAEKEAEVWRERRRRRRRLGAA